ncbi:syntaxin-16-like isoform X2 [Tubulanus polymorphus]|uniref:syntaxin-16-like isoform X2 n=1 Tax=Tubulanus polymorphus TaxID=672921 RepID=UPI003DA41609
MATRSLTEVFILMRNNAMQNRHIFSEQTYSDDRTALVSHSSRDVELGLSNNSPTNKLPPEWIDGVEEVQYEVSRIKQKWKELSTLHDKHMNRPTLDDSVDEEHAIEIQTREITQMFSRCQRLVQQIVAKGRHATIQEQKVTNNITNALARTLTELSTTFRQGQSNYLKKLKNREERSNRYFQTDMTFMDEQTTAEDEVYDRGFTDVQLRIVEDNSIMVQQREKEIAQIVRSIHDLNEIFKDLASMVVDQGTILDRIDFNLEQTQSTVESGLQQLQKAEKYQKKNRKMLCILGLAVTIILLIIILISVKHN